MAHGGEKEKGWIPEPVRKAVRVKHSWNLVRLTFRAKVFNTSWPLESSGKPLWNTSVWFHTQRFWFNCSEVGPRHPKVFTAIQVILKGSQFNNYLRAGLPVLWCAEKSQRRHSSRRGLLWWVLCPAAVLAPCWVSLSLFSNDIKFYLQPFSRPNPRAGKDTDIILVSVHLQECKLAPNWKTVPPGIEFLTRRSTEGARWWCSWKMWGRSSKFPGFEWLVHPFWIISKCIWKLKRLNN